MKQFLFIITLLLFLVNISFAKENTKKENGDTVIADTVRVEAKVLFVPNVTVYTPTKEIYDDGADLVRYEGYTLYNSDNKQIIRVKPSLDKPVRLKLSPGNYIVKLDEKRSLVYSISVSENRYNEFTIK